MTRLSRLTGYALLAAGTWMLVVASVSAQETTERYIPIGQSPGVSGKYSYVGRIVAVDTSDHAVTVEDDKGRHRLRVTEETSLWLDRNKSKRRNMTASFHDCRVGRRVEIMYTHDDKRVARWIKIEN